jgi:hypothetical protein
LNYLIKGVLSIPIFLKISSTNNTDKNTNNELLNCVEVFILISTILLAAPIIGIIFISIFGICCVLLSEIFKFLNYCAKKITFTVEETYITEITDA